MGWRLANTFGVYGRFSAVFHHYQRKFQFQQYMVQVYTWFPPQSAALTHAVQNLVTDQTAGSAYGINEQTMLNNLKTDVSNIQAALSNLYANLKTAGYTL